MLPVSSPCLSGARGRDTVTTAQTVPLTPISCRARAVQPLLAGKSNIPEAGGRAVEGGAPCRGDPWLAAPAHSRSLLRTGVVPRPRGATDTDAGLAWELLCQEVLVQLGGAASKLLPMCSAAERPLKLSWGTHAGPALGGCHTLPREA